MHKGLLLFSWTKRLNRMCRVWI